ncbi:MAG: GH32 C-terminal domain-containing protein, partial [Gemmatimonadota bacterium]
VRLRDAATLAPVLEWSCDEELRLGSLGGCEYPLHAASSGGRQLRLIWDRSMAELFVDDGRQVCTRVIEGATGGPVIVEWFARHGRVHVDRCSTWPLDGIW